MYSRMSSLLRRRGRSRGDVRLVADMRCLQGISPTLRRAESARRRAGNLSSAPLRQTHCFTVFVSSISFRMAGAISAIACAAVASPIQTLSRDGWSACELIGRSEEHTSELQSHHDLVCRLLLEKKKQKKNTLHKQKKQKKKKKN